MESNVNNGKINSLYVGTWKYLIRIKLFYIGIIKHNR